MHACKCCTLVVLQFSHTGGIIDYVLIVTLVTVHIYLTLKVLVNYEMC